jgi:4-amino-4-deoxy-L-arabinose transferase-like glycosyltransferase
MASMNLKSPNKIVNHQKYFFILYAAIAFVLYFKLGEQPLQMEEPRRAMVALEMDLSGQYVAPTLYGEFYYNKPPLWNWMILLGYKIFVSYSGLAVRFFSVLSFLLMGLSIYFIGKKYISDSFGAYSSLFFMISGDILFHFSQLGEIDLFYSYITFLCYFFDFSFL